MIYDLKVDEIGENSPYWYVSKNISNDQKVLDVGCATGYLGEYLKNFFDFELIGVDYDDYYLKKADERHIYSNLIKLDLNNFENELNDYVSYFDRIIVCDVLEHLNNPMAVLKNLSRFLKDNGKFLIDVPNISHAAIKYNLLINKFDYTPFGLLDETHVRFFTIDSLIKDLTKNSFLIKDMEFIILVAGQYHDQFVDYSKYPQGIIDLIENDFQSSVYQIFTVFEKSDLDFESLIKINSHFQQWNPELTKKKEKFVPNNYDNSLKGLEDIIQDKEKMISDLNDNITEKAEIISILESRNSFLNDNITEKAEIISVLESRISELKENINEKVQINYKLKTSIQNKNDTILQMKEDIGNLKSIINEIKSSRSWKLTKPLRNFSFIIKK